MSECEIIFDSSQSVYCPGDKLSGYVYVNLPKKVDKVRLEASGIANVCFWYDQSNNGDRCSSEIVYFKDYLTLWEKNKEKGEKWVPGSKYYPFSLTIPHDIAPSFESIHGNVRFKLKAELDIPWAVDKYCEREFKVGIPIDLNSVSIYTQPQSTSIHKSSILSSSKALEATISIPRLAWAVDETIPVKCDITNNSVYNVSEIEVTVIKKENFTGKSFLFSNQQTEKSTRRMQSVRIDVSILASESKEVQVDVAVSSDLVTVINCPIMSVDYELDVTLHFDSVYASPLSTSLPVIFSNVPLTN